jgi:transaldolase
MTDDEDPKLIYLGTYESGANTITIPRAALAAVEQKIEAKHAEAERQRLAQIADAARLQNTRQAKTMRKLGKALRAFVRMS